MTLPTWKEIEALHRKHAPSELVYNLVWTHCRVVRDIALQLIEDSNLAVDRGLVEAGCLLHDIGTYPLFTSEGELRTGEMYITHGIKGEAIIVEEGLPQTLARFASHHTGIGIKKEDILKQKLPIPLKDYLAETDEELLVMYADNFQPKSAPEYCNSYVWYENYLGDKFGLQSKNKFRAMREKFGQPDLEAIAKKWSLKIR